MTTTDPKLIERIARTLERGLALEVESGVLASELTHMERRAIAETILPIVASAIDEAVAAERAGIVAWLRGQAAIYNDQNPNLSPLPEWTLAQKWANAIERREWKEQE